MSSEKAAMTPARSRGMGAGLESYMASLGTTTLLHGFSAIYFNMHLLRP